MGGSDVVMVVLTGVSAVAAIASLGVARRATGAAAGAVLEAKDANKIAKGANVLAQGANDLSAESNKISASAAQDARDVPKAVAWNEYLIVLAALQTFDPTSEPVGDRLTNLRTRAFLLIDLLDWDGFDTWLATEQQAIVLLMHEARDKGVSERLRLGRDLTVDEILDIDQNMHTRVVALTTNVRRCRKVGEHELPYDKFTEWAWESIRDTCARNGWDVPTGKIDGIEPYDPSD